MLVVCAKKISELCSFLDCRASLLPFKQCAFHQQAAKYFQGEIKGKLINGIYYPKTASKEDFGYLSSESLPYTSLTVFRFNKPGLLIWKATPLMPQGFLHQQLRFSRHPHKPPSREIFRPNIPGPEALPCSKYRKLNPMQSFIPINYYPQRAVEALRTGEYLGEDAPWNLLPWKTWKRRKYNVATESIPWKLSKEKGVGFHKRLNVWTTQWTEDGVHRIRRFRAAFGIMKAKENAERFRRDLEASGRVDNRRTVRQKRLVHIQKRDELRIRKKRFAKIASGQF